MILDTSIYFVLLLVVQIVSGDAGGVQIEGIFAMYIKNFVKLISQKISYLFPRL